MSTACDRCGVELPEEALRYIVEIHVTADVTPVLDVDISEAEVEAALEEVLEELEQADPGEAEAQVHSRFVYLLCPSCRARFVKDPIGTGHSGSRPLH